MNSKTRNFGSNIIHGPCKNSGTALCNNFSVSATISNSLQPNRSLCLSKTWKWFQKSRKTKKTSKSCESKQALVN